MRKIFIVAAFLLFAGSYAWGHGLNSQDTTGVKGESPASQVPKVASTFKIEAQNGIVGQEVKVKISPQKRNETLPEKVMVSSTVQGGQSSFFRVGEYAVDENGSITLKPELKKGTTIQVPLLIQSGKAGVTSSSLNVTLDVSEGFFTKADTIAKLRSEIDSLRTIQGEKMPKKESPPQHKKDAYLVPFWIVLALLCLWAGFFVWFANKNKNKKKLQATQEDKKKLEQQLGDAAMKVSADNEEKMSKLSKALDSKDKEIDELRVKLNMAMKGQNAHNASSGNGTSKPASTQAESAAVKTKVLYGDVIVNGVFSRVRETPDRDETNFELRLAHANDTTAKVLVHVGAYARILANPAFLEGCDKQVIGSNCRSVATAAEGIAHKEGNKWIITSKPKVKIS